MRLVSNISSDWNHKCSRNILLECDLDRFSDEEARNYLEKMDLADSHMISRLMKETEGYPWLLEIEIEIENLKSKKGSAHTNKMFYDRTTRWMGLEEKQWFENLCYLDVVNIDTIKCILPEYDSKLVYQWFENEPSIRDASSDKYAVKGIIKTKVLKYLEIKSPETHQRRISLIRDLTKEKDGEC